MLSFAAYLGTFLDVNQDPFQYSVNGVSLRLLEPVRGSLTALGALYLVSFPSDAFEMSLSTGDVVLDSVSLGEINDLSLKIDQVSGVYSGGALILNIGYETIDSSISITLTTF